MTDRFFTFVLRISVDHGPSHWFCSRSLVTGSTRNLLLFPHYRMDEAMAVFFFRHLIFLEDYPKGLGEPLQALDLSFPEYMERKPFHLDRMWVFLLMKRIFPISSSFASLVSGVKNLDALM